MNYSSSNIISSTDNVCNSDIKDLNVDDDRGFYVSTDEQVFEIFGLKLFFDDILLICILFFLYNEGVKDQGLFIALILLLLS